MDARTFGKFLAEELKTAAKTFEQNLLQANYKGTDATDTLVQTHRGSAYYTCLLNLSEQIPALVEKFYNAGAASAPSSDTQGQ